MNKPAISVLKEALYQILPQELANGMTLNLESSISNYQIRQYSATVLNSGKFVEFAIRALEYLAQKNYTPLSDQLPKFTNQRLEEFAKSFGDEPCRTLIPRALFSMYCIRNKRGGIHVAISEPNRLDATKLIHDMKWIIYEFTSIGHSLKGTEGITALEDFSSPLTQIVWDVDGTKRILSNCASCSEQILLLLSCSRMTIEQLHKATEYKNSTRFKNIIQSLHKRKLINCHNGVCTISPLGIAEVEKVIKKIDEDTQ